MNGTPTTFWGKLHRATNEAGEPQWHPLVDHCADVAACAEALLALPTWRRRLARVAGLPDLDSITCSRLAVLAALHDLGKFNLGFQAKGRADLGATAGHVTPAVAAIGKGPFRSVDELGSWGNATLGLLVSALCHHGRPFSIEQPERHEPIRWEARGGLDPSHGVASLVKRCRTWFPQAFVEGPPLADAPRFEHAFAGLVMLADWLGSDEQIFKYSEPGDGDRIAFARETAAAFLARAWINIGDRRGPPATPVATFARLVPNGFRMRPAQRALLDLPVDDVGSVTILESETGSGKTEAALARFLELFDAGVVDGLYFALPTRTAAMQMYDRVLKAAVHAFADPPPVLLAVPGYMRVDGVDPLHLLPEFTVLWPDHGRQRFRGWAAERPKRYLAGCIAVGTIDQVLLSALRVGHAHLRATAMLRQLLVVDEVHASDHYMARILEEVLARHVGAGGHALLLSATLGCETRTRLLEARVKTAPPTLDEGLAVPYPLISHSGRQRIALGLPQTEQRSIALERLPLLEDVDNVAARAVEAALHGATVFVVKNTVANCVATQRAVEACAESRKAGEVLFTCRGLFAPHHARYSRVDREALDAHLEARVRADCRSARGCVVVATQTVQQSLDLDVDFMITDLCPADVLIQRLGRLHRHSRPRPRGFESPRATVLVPANRDLGALLGRGGRARNHHGLGTVYDDLRVVEATWRLLENHALWRLPAMSRWLVEHSVHSEALSVISVAGGADWLAHETAILGAQRGDVRQAQLNLIDWTTPYSYTAFPEGEHVPTRLGEDDRLVHFKPTFQGPFGLSVGELTVPGRWARGVAADASDIAAVCTRDGVASFRFGDRQFVYDRYGLRLEQESREAGDSNDDGS